MSARPLYLNPSEEVVVSCDAEVALRVRSADSPARRIPLTQLSRVVANSRTRWDSQALLACMTRGIPVSFVDHHGKPIGWCFGQRRRETTLGNLLHLALDSPDWDQHYPCWLDNQRRAAAAHALVMCGERAAFDQLRSASSTRDVLCNAHTRKHGTATGDAVSAIAHLATQEFAASLDQAVVQSELLAWHRPGLNLIDDIGGIVGVYAHVGVHHARSLPAPGMLEKWAIKHYEGDAELWAPRIGGIIGNFERFLREHWL